MTRGSVRLSRGVLLHVMFTERKAAIACSAVLDAEDYYPAQQQEFFVAPTYREAWAALSAWVDQKLKAVPQ